MSMDDQAYINYLQNKWFATHNTQYDRELDRFCKVIELDEALHKNRLAMLPR